MDNRIETENLVLRVLRPTESALVAAFYARNYDDFANYEPLNKRLSLSIHYQHKVLEYEDGYRANNTRIRYYIFRKYDPFRAIGTISFRDINKEPGITVVGYKIDKNFRRRGYAKETLKVLIPLMKKTYGIRQIRAEVLPDNNASSNLLVGLGFHRIAKLVSRVEIRGSYRDEYLYILNI